MNADFEWLRIALAMALMGTAFIALPVFFLWNDNRKAAKQDARDAHDPSAEADLVDNSADLTDLYDERERAVTGWARSSDASPRSPQ